MRNRLPQLFNLPDIFGYTLNFLTDDEFQFAFTALINISRIAIQKALTEKLLERSGIPNSFILKQKTLAHSTLALLQQPHLGFPVRIKILIDRAMRHKKAATNTQLYQLISSYRKEDGPKSDELWDTFRSRYNTPATTAPRVANDQLESTISESLARLSNEDGGYWDARQLAGKTLREIVPDLSDEQLMRVANALIAKLNNEEDIYCAYVHIFACRLLAIIAPRLPKNQLTPMVNTLLAKLMSENGNDILSVEICEAVSDAITTIVPYLSSDHHHQLESIVNKLLKKVSDGSRNASFQIRHNMLSTLCSLMVLFPKLATQENILSIDIRLQITSEAMQYFIPRLPMPKNATESQQTAVVEMNDVLAHYYLNPGKRDALLEEKIRSAFDTLITTRMIECQKRTRSDGSEFFRKLAANRESAPYFSTEESILARLALARIIKNADGSDVFRDPDNAQTFCETLDNFIKTASCTNALEPV